MLCLLIDRGTHSHLAYLHFLSKRFITSVHATANVDERAMPGYMGDSILIQGKPYLIRVSMRRMNVTPFSVTYAVENGEIARRQSDVRSPGATP
jgi:hypothetical protein